MTDPRLFEIAVTWQPPDEYDRSHGAVELTAKHYWDDACTWHDRPYASDYHQPWTYIAGVLSRAALAVHKLDQSDVDIFHRTRDGRVAPCCTVWTDRLTDPVSDLGATPVASISVNAKRRTAALRTVSGMLETIRAADARTFPAAPVLEVAG